MSSGPIWLVPRTWFDEVERIGMQRCTPIGYAINSLGALVWMAGLLGLPAMLVYFVYRAIAGTFHWSLLWWPALPLLMVISGSILIGVSWYLACRREFHYDYDRRESTWIKAGARRCYRISDLESESR